MLNNRFHTYTAFSLRFACTKWHQMPTREERKSVRRRAADRQIANLAVSIGRLPWRAPSYIICTAASLFLDILNIGDRANCHASGVAYAGRRRQRGAASSASPTPPDMRYRVTCKNSPRANWSRILISPHHSTLSLERETQKRLCYAHGVAMRGERQDFLVLMSMDPIR
jgi:hypothetical protein